MFFLTKNNRSVFIRRFTLTDTEPLLTYLHQLSHETKQRFGPHPFTAESIQQLYQQPLTHIGFIAIDIETSAVIAYSIIKIGFLLHDEQRLRSYGLTLSTTADCTFAPSVADAWQSTGVGTAMLQYITAELKTHSIDQIILWGGVQASNEKAVNYYRKHHYHILGAFEYNGNNYDMICSLV